MPQQSDHCDSTLIRSSRNEKKRDVCPRNSLKKERRTEIQHFTPVSPFLCPNNTAAMM